MGRLEEDAACTDKEMRGSELLGGVSGLGHGGFDGPLFLGLCVCVCGGVCKKVLDWMIWEEGIKYAFGGVVAIGVFM